MNSVSPLRGTPLSAREVEVLRLVADGLTDAEIGQRLSIAEDTVGSHMHRIRARLGESTRGGVVRAAFEQEWLRLPDEVILRQAHAAWERVRQRRVEQMRAELAQQAARRGAA